MQAWEGFAHTCAATILGWSAPNSSHDLWLLIWHWKVTRWIMQFWLLVNYKWILHCNLIMYQYLIHENINKKIIIPNIFFLSWWIYNCILHYGGWAVNKLSDHLKIRNSIILAIFYLFINNKKTFGTFSVF